MREQERVLCLRVGREPDRPEGVPPHPRYEENKLAQLQRNRNAGVEASFAANCRLFKKDINVPCLTGTD